MDFGHFPRRLYLLRIPLSKLLHRVPISLLLPAPAPSIQAKVFGLHLTLQSSSLLDSPAQAWVPGHTPWGIHPRPT